MSPRRAARARTRGRRLELRRASVRDLDILVDHRIGMWRDIGGRTERTLHAHEPVYRAWASPRLRSGELEAVLVQVDGHPAGSGALWWMPAQPRPGFPAATSPYILSVYTRPEYRGLGVATAVVEGLIRRARRRGATRVSLHASAMGKGVYERLGFEVTTEMRKWLRASARPPHPAAPVSPRRAPAGSRR